MSPSDHMGRIAAMPCICCSLLDREQESRTLVHHIREDREARNDWLTLPLCWACHQGPLGIHGNKSFLRMLKMSEWGLLGEIIKRLT